jgi:hypothetical protein
MSPQSSIAHYRITSTLGEMGSLSIRERHRALKSMRPSDMHAESAVERVGGDPKSHAGHSHACRPQPRRPDALAMVAGNAVDVETRVRDAEYL